MCRAYEKITKHLSQLYHSFNSSSLPPVPSLADGTVHSFLVRVLARPTTAHDSIPNGALEH